MKNTAQFSKQVLNVLLTRSAFFLALTAHSLGAQAMGKNLNNPPPAVQPPVVQPPSPPADLGDQQFKFEAPSWETANSDGARWTEIARQAIYAYGDAMLSSPGPNDVGDFCPNFANLPAAQKVNFWLVLLSEMVRYESGFDPTSRYQESTMGIDPVTGQPVYSEGLLQLSYQDIQPHPYCQFDWSVDRFLGPRDPRKTIFNVENNLTCGIRILERQLQRRNQIAVSRGAYWSVILSGGRYNKLAPIQKKTNALKFCQSD